MYIAGTIFIVFKILCSFILIVVCQSVKKLSNESLVVFDLRILPEVYSMHNTVDENVEDIDR